MHTRLIPSTGEALPVIGLGTWQTFDVDPPRYPMLEKVLRTMQTKGGKLIDTSPMYGRAEAVTGEVTSALEDQDNFFYATKVWTTGASAGADQIAASCHLMKRKVMDLIQIHNLVDWSTHLAYLRHLKEEGRLRYIGITHYQDSSHEALAGIIRKEPIDFIQFNYSILSRHAEKFLLPLCADKGVATLINRPFGEGLLFRKFAHSPVPPWAAEQGIKTWSAFFLKFILANEAVTCVIPATGNADHAKENFEAGEGALPDEALLKKMVDHIA